MPKRSHFWGTTGIFLALLTACELPSDIKSLQNQVAEKIDEKNQPDEIRTPSGHILRTVHGGVLDPATKQVWYFPSILDQGEHHLVLNLSFDEAEKHCSEIGQNTRLAFKEEWQKFDGYLRDGKRVLDPNIEKWFPNYKNRWFWTGNTDNAFSAYAFSSYGYIFTAGRANPGGVLCIYQMPPG